MCVVWSRSKGHVLARRLGPAAPGQPVADAHEEHGAEREQAQGAGWTLHGDGRLSHGALR